MPTSNPLVRLHSFGQSIWLDLLSRNLLRSGKLADLVQSDAVSGVTSNPAIFDKAIGQSSDYDEDIHSLTEAGKTASEIFRALTIGDIREAADILRPTYTRTDGEDGYVSLEVSPLLARDTRATVDEAGALWRAVDRPNVMIKIPATREGLPRSPNRSPPGSISTSPYCSVCPDIGKLPKPTFAESSSASRAGMKFAESALSPASS